jgi:hypothetical protein
VPDWGIFVVFGCVVLALLVLKLDGRARAWLDGRRSSPWPTYEPRSHVGLHHQGRDAEGGPFDWQKDDDWQPRLFRRL